MKIIEKLIEGLMVLLPFLKKREPQAVKEFTELVKGQYDYLLEIIQTFQRDYFELSQRLKRMNQEIISLNEQLRQALQLKCMVKECVNRV